MQARVIRTDFGEVKARGRGLKGDGPNFRPRFTSGYAPANGGLSDRSAAATAHNVLGPFDVFQSPCQLMFPLPQSFIVVREECL